MPKYIVVTGGVLSGLGKGIVTASIGVLLKARGFKVSPIKCDGYLNYDAGTLRPTEHGEVWVTKDGGEIDQDLGHYERFLDIDVPKLNNITSGQIYWQVVKNEREGKYLGKTVQLIPHVTDEIKRRFRLAAKNSDFALIEIGGTVGDYENAIFIEAARQLRQEGESVIYVHVSYVPIPKHLGEAKTKPTQLSVKTLLSMGIQPDFIVARCEKPLDSVRKKKIAMFCNVPIEHVISDPNVEITYEVPLIFEEQGFGDLILKKFGMQKRKARLEKWRRYIERIKSLRDEVKIGIVGKYFKTGEYKLTDSYISVIEAVKHASWKLGVKPRILFISSDDVERKVSVLDLVDGIIVPGGFGKSGVAGKIKAIRYAREHNKPYLGLCFGMQLAVVEFARHVCKLHRAHSTEIMPGTPHPVIDLLPWQKELLKQNKYGATMRLGEHKVKIKPRTLARKLYKKRFVYRRFRHRYEVNPRYVKTLEKAGVVFSGTTPSEDIMQIMELPSNDFFFATQYHPEFSSRFFKPEEAFVGFVKACVEGR